LYDIIILNMADNFQTTFIPKASGKEVTSVISSSPMNKGYTLEKVLTLITLLIFVLTCIAYGYLWTKKISLQSKKAEIEQTLEDVKASLEDGELDAISELNRRLLASTKLYNDHLSPVGIFPILEDFTLKSATLNNFLYEYLEDETVHIFANGSAANYQSVIRLTDRYEESEHMKRILVTDPKKQTDGTVSFAFEAFVDTDILRYKNKEFNNTTVNTERDEGLVTNEEE